MNDKTISLGCIKKSTVTAVRSDGERVTLKRRELTRHIHNLPKEGSDVSYKYSIGLVDLEEGDDDSLFDPNNPSLTYRIE